MTAKQDDTLQQTDNQQPAPEADFFDTRQHFFSIGQAAKILGISIDTLRNWEEQGKITPTRTPGGTRKYKLSLIKRILEENPKLYKRLPQRSESNTADNPVSSTKSLLDNAESISKASLTGIESYLKPIDQSVSYPQNNPSSTYSLNYLKITVTSLCLLTLVIIPAVLGVSYLKAHPQALKNFPLAKRVMQMSGLVPTSNTLLANNQLPVSGVLAADTEVGYLEINSDLNLKNNLVLEGDAIATNNFEIQKDLKVKGATEFTGNATFRGGISIASETSSTGISVTASGVTITGSSTFSGDTNINGLSTITNTGTGNSFIVNDEASDTTALVIDSSGNLGIGVNPTSSNSYKLNVSGTLNSSGATSLGSTLAVTGATTLSSTLTTSGKTVLKDVLEVTGATTLSSTIEVGGAATFSSTGIFSGNLTASSQILAKNGTVSSPSYSFSNDTNTGIYRNGADTLGIVAGGTEIFTIDSTGIVPTTSSTYNLGSATKTWSNVYVDTLTASSTTVSGQLLLPNGSASVPAMAFTNSTGAGLWRVGSNSIALTTSGSGTSGITIDSAGNIGVGVTSPSAKLDILGGDHNSAGFILKSADTFSPDSISGMKAWYKADTLSGVSDGDAVSSWSDSSGNGYTLTQATGDAQPVYKTSIFNGKPVVRFDGLSDYIQNASFADLNGQNYTIFMVSQSRDKGSSGNVWATPLNISNGTSRVIHWEHVQTNTILRLYTTTSTAVGKAGYTNYTPTIITTRYNSSSNYDAYVNGLLWGSGATSGPFSSTTNTIRIGADEGLSSSTWWKADMAELIIYQGALTDAQRIQIETYLAKKWDIAYTNPTAQAFSQWQDENGNALATIDETGGLIFNQPGLGTGNLLVKGQTDPFLLYTNAGSNTVGIGTTGTSYKLDIRQSLAGNIFGLEDGNNNTILGINDGGQTTFKPASFDKVYTCVPGEGDCVSSGTFTDNTTEAKTSAGTAFTVLSDSTNYFYVGLDHPYSSIYFNMATALAGTGASLTPQYYNGSSWTTLFNGYSDGTSVLTQSGAVTFTSPGDWAQTSVNSQYKYWVRFSIAYTTLTTAPTAKSVSPTSGNRFYLYSQAGDTNPAFFLNDKGNLGIGTASPTSLLSITGGNVGIGVSTAISTLAINGNSTIGWGVTGVAGPSNGLAVLGNVGIGTSTTSHNLEVVGTSSFSSTLSLADGTFSTPGLNFTSDANSGLWRIGANQIALTTGGGSHSGLAINSSGNVGIGNTNASNLFQINPNGSTAFVVNSSGNIGIGWTSPTAPLQIHPRLPQTATGSVATGTKPWDDFGVQGNYAYLSPGNFEVYDISNPSSPVQISSTSGASSRGTIVHGKFAYNHGDSIKVWDISNPYSPIVVSTISFNAMNVNIQGNYLYGHNGTIFSIYDISNPYSATLKGSYSLSIGGDSSIRVDGEYAYIADTNGNFYILDISNPANITPAGSLGSLSAGPAYIDVVGRYVYLAGGTTANLYVVDVSNPALPVLTSTITTAGKAYGPASHGLVVHGKYLYLSSNDTNQISVYDISSPASPTLIGNVTTVQAGPRAIFVQGRYLYTSTRYGNTLEIYDIGGMETPSLTVGDIDSGSIMSRTNVLAMQNLIALGGLSVGQASMFSGSVGIGVTSSTAALSITQNGNGNLLDLFNGSTHRLSMLSNGNLGIGTSTPGSLLTITGGNVGIGTSAAGASLQVNGGGLFGWGTTSVTAPTNGLAVLGNVGIGTTSTSAALHVVGDITNPGGSQSEKFGSGAVADGTLSLAVGYGATTSSFSEAVAIGRGANVTNNFSTAVGYNASAARRGVALGNEATANQQSVALGRAATSTDHSVALGYSANADEQHSLVIGQDGESYINNIYFGYGRVSATPNTATLNATGGSGTNITGGTLQIAGGRGTGSGEGGPIIFSTSSAGDSGTSLNSLSERMRITSAGNVGIGNTNTSQLFQVNPDGATAFVVTSEGNVGIGTTSPAYAFEIVGPSMVTTARISSSDGFGNLRIGTSGVQLLNEISNALRIDAGAVADGSTAGWIYTRHGGSSNKLYLGDTGSASWIQSGHAMYLRSNEGSGPDATANPHLTINSGNVGINTASPYARFQTVGSGTDAGLSLLTTDSNGTQRFAILDNGNVGIGTTAPQVALHVLGGNVGIGTSAAGVALQVNGGGLFGWGTASTALSAGAIAAFNGNVGIGTTSPASTLEITPTTSTDTTLTLKPYRTGSGYDGLLTIQRGTNTTSRAYLQFATAGGNYWNVGMLNTPTSNDSLSFSSVGNMTGSAQMVLTTAGNLGIGNSAAAYKLDVTGDTRVTGGALVGFGTGTIASIPTNGLAVYGNVGIGTTSPLTALQVWGDNTNSAFFLNGNVGIGTTIPSTQLHVSGSIPTAAIGTATGVGTPYAIDVQGNYAYIKPVNDMEFYIYDVSVPSSPVLMSSNISPGRGSAVVVKGKYAYIKSYNPAQLVIIDISNPKSPVIIGTLAQNGSGKIDVQGSFVYIANNTNNRLDIVDVSNPYRPKLVGSVSTSATPRGIKVQGSYAYITANGDDKLEIYNIVNPSNPIFVGSVTTDDSPYYLYVEGRYAYVPNYGSATLQVIDISNPASPSVVATKNTDTQPISVAVQGRYAYVANYGSNTVQVFDVSIPSTPQTIGSFGTDSGPEEVIVKGRYAYVVNVTSLTMQIFDLGGAYIQQLEGGGAEFSQMSILKDLQVNGAIDVAGGLNVGNGGMFSAGSVGIGVSTGASIPALTVSQQWLGPAAVFLGGNVGIGTTIPTAKLSIQGNVGIGYTSVSIPNNGLAVLGNIGIGTTTATHNLEVIGTGAFSDTLSLANGSASTPALNFTNSATSGLWSPSTNALSLTTNGSDTSGITITAAGNVGIGTTAPISAFDVYKAAAGDLVAAFGNPTIGSSPSIYMNIESGGVISLNGAYGKNSENIAWWINRNGYLGGTSQSRTLYIGNGQGSAIATFAGNGGVSVANGFTVGNGLTLTTGALNLTSTSGQANLALSSNTNAFTVNNLFGIDTTSNRVGIGTTAPQVALHVLGGNVGIGTSAAGAALQVNGGGLFGWGTTSTALSSGAIAGFNGNVGIGTTSPSVNLEVNGAAQIDGSSSIYNNLLVYDSSTTIDSGFGHGIAIQAATAGDAPSLLFQSNTGSLLGAMSYYTSGNGFYPNTMHLTAYGNVPLVFDTNNNERMRILGNGNVGIGGDTSPDNLFAVGSTSQFQVDSSGAIAAVTGIITSGGYTQSGADANLFTGNVGIGASAAGSALQVNGGITAGWGTASTALSSGAILGVNGNVGIGTTSPLSTLDVLGTAWLRGSSTTTGLTVTSVGNVGIGITAPSQAFQVGSGTQSLVYNSTYGYLGIGTTSPSNRLEVYGGTSTFTDTTEIDGTGTDGACSITDGTITLDAGASNSCAGRGTADAVNYNIATSLSAGDSTINVGATPTGIAAGDEILVINLRGTSTDYANVGKYETHYITNVSGNILTLDKPLTNTYDGTTQKIMVQRIPQYTTVTIGDSTGAAGSAVLTISAYSNTNGEGGVIFFRATGAVTINSDGKVDGAGKGYAGGGAGAGGATYNGTGGAGGGDAGNGSSGQGGGGGMGRNASTAGSGTTGGAGGGGGFFTGGGGGGGYGGVGLTTGTGSSGSGTTGGTGGSNNSPAYGDSGGGGGTYGSANLSQIYFGSGGGGGAEGGNGGIGGGIIGIFASSITTSGSISTNGADGATTLNGNRGGGGAGSGGSIWIKALTSTLGSSLITASGGSGGTGGENVGKNGGAGGVGRIRVDSSSSSGATSPAAGYTGNMSPSVVVNRLNSIGDILGLQYAGTDKFRVDSSGNILSAAGAIWKPLVDSTTALGIGNSAATMFVTFDTQNQRMGIGTTGPRGLLEVGNSSTNPALLISTDGNIGIGTSVTSNPLTIGTEGTNGNGAYLTAGGTWTNGSSIEFKENFVSLNDQEVLAKINALPILQWNYKNEDPSIRHIGPIAENFYDLFNVGNDRKHISTIDPAGIALLGIQALSAKEASLSAKLKFDSDGSLIVSSIKTGKITLDPTLILMNNNMQLSEATGSGSLNPQALLTTGTLASSDNSSTDVAQSIQVMQQDILGLQTSSASTSAQLATLESKLKQIENEVINMKNTEATSSTSSTPINNQSSSNSASDSATISSQTALESTSSISIDTLNLTPPETLLATSSATLTNLNVTSEATVSGTLMAYDSTISNIFKSLGHTILGNTTVAGDITQDGTLSITKGSRINALPILYLQDSPLASAVDLFNGKVTIDYLGKITAYELSVNKIYVSGDTLGEVIIPAGTTEVTIQTPQVSDKSRIFAVAQNEIDTPLFISQKTPGQGFKIKLRATQATDAIVDWWIVDNR